MCFLGCDTNELMNPQDRLAGSCGLGCRKQAPAGRGHKIVSFEGSREDGSVLGIGLSFCEVPHSYIQVESTVGGH